MKLNKKLEIGINAIAALKKRGANTGPVKTALLAEEIGTTPNFLEQIMRNLRVSGIVSVQRGPGGGYSLNHDPELTAYAVAKAVGRFPDNLNDGDASVPAQLRKNILEAFRSTKL